MLFALIAFGFAIALSNSNWYYAGSFGKVAPVYCSIVVAVGGTFGLFALKKRPDSTHDAKLFLLVLYIDCWAVILTIIGGAMFWANGNEYGYYNDLDGMIVAGGVLSHLNTIVILYPIVRTLRLWWKRILYTVPQEAVHEPQTIYIQQPHPQYVQPVYIVNDHKPNPQSRPLSEAQASTISAATLNYRPSIAETTQGIPTRAPSYTTHADAGARMEKQ